MADEHKNITLPDLPYDYAALEPHIDTATMKLHHDFHHKGYTSKFAAAYKNLCDNHAAHVAGGISKLLLADSLAALPDKVRGAVQNNGGGWVNHTLFWNNMAPAGNGGGGEPDGELGAAIKEEFGSFDEFKKVFGDAGATRFGSGWAWLVYNPKLGNKTGLKVYSTPNQDGPHMNADETPILGLDVWEHAYYLKYQNRRPEYIAAFWNVANWGEANKRYTAAKQ